MAISFGPAKLANNLETRSYGRMNILPADSYTDKAWSERVSIDHFKEGGPSTFYCFMGYYPFDGMLLCSYKGPTDKARTNTSVISWTIPNKLEIRGVTYGDIDKDGDIDIAVKLMNGAIYVFHNLQVNK